MHEILKKIKHVEERIAFFKDKMSKAHAADISVNAEIAALYQEEEYLTIYERMELKEAEYNLTLLYQEYYSKKNKEKALEVFVSKSTGRKYYQIGLF